MEEKKEQRIKEVRVMLEDFGKNKLSTEIAGYVVRLWDMIGRKRKYVITGGKKEVWASAVIYLIARLNFLFDKTQPNYLSPDSICNYFGTKKSTVSSKAAEIEKACKIRIGHEGLCSEHISDTLSFVELPNGMIVSKKMAKDVGILIQ